MIRDEFFGVIETGYGEVDQLEHTAGVLNANGIRWPGGTLAETRTDVYDLSFSDLFNSSSFLEGNKNLIRSGLSDVLARSNETGELNRDGFGGG